MLCVVLILALVSGIAAYRLRPTLAAARLKSGIRRLTAADRQLRDHARRHGRSARLEFDLDRGIVHRVAMTEAQQAWSPTSLGTEIEGIRTLSGETRHGTATIAVNVRGESETYAIHFSEGPGSRWLVVLGMTGQPVEVEDGGDINAIFQFSRAARPDVD